MPRTMPAARSRGERFVRVARRGRLDVLLLAELAVLVDVQPLRVVGGLTLALILPGMAITRSAPPNAVSDRPARLLLIPALSIATLVITGFLLYALEVRFTGTSWAIALGVVTIAVVAIGELLDQRQVVRVSRDSSGSPSPTASTPGTGDGPPLWPVVSSPTSTATAASLSTGDGGLGPPEIPPRRGPGFAGRRWLVPQVALSLLLLVAAFEVTVAVVVASSGERSSHGPGFTQLWALPTSHKPFSIDVGIRSYQRQSTRYAIVVTANRRVVLRGAVALAPGRLWKSTVAIGGPVGQRVDVTLRLAHDRSMYRHLQLWTGDAPPASPVASGKTSA